jgi:hypothetical protein
MTDWPRVSHELVVAFRFLDAFSGGEIGAPLEVSAPALPFVPGVLMPRVPWPAVAHGGSYRFKTSNREVAPVGSIPFEVVDPAGIYASFEPIVVALPRPLSTPPSASDLLIERKLWPTRKFRPRAPETEVVLVVRSAGATNVAGLRAFLWKHTGGPPPSLPYTYTYTDAAGETLFRLLGSDYKLTPTGGSTVSIDVELRLPPLFATSATIVSPAFPTTIDLGAINVLFVNVP